MLAQDIFNHVVARAEATLAARTPEPPSPPPVERCEQHVQLDKFFSTKRFCEHHDAAIELVSILTGYKPQPVKKIEVVPFSILYCKSINECWIVIFNGAGFCRLELSTLHVDNNCETIPLLQQARSYLEWFKKTDPVEFLAWCRKHLDRTTWIYDL